MAKKISPEQQAVFSASDAGYYATTIKLANEVLAKEPENIRVWIELGHACWQLARYQAAEAALRNAEDLCTPDQRDVIYGEFGHLYRTQGDFVSAAQWFEKQIATDPSDATGFLFLGSLQLRRGDLDAAEQTLIRALKCEIGSLEEIHFTLGLVYAARNDLSGAANQFEKTLAIDPKHATAKKSLKDMRSAA